MRPLASARPRTFVVANVAPFLPMRFTAISISVSAQKASTACARAAASATSSRCETAPMPCAKAIIISLNACKVLMSTIPLRHASCNPARNSRKPSRSSALRASTGCHKPPTRPSQRMRFETCCDCCTVGQNWSGKMGASASNNATVSISVLMPGNAVPAALLGMIGLSTIGESKPIKSSSLECSGAIAPSCGSIRSSRSPRSCSNTSR